jgi:Domain of unknown function (DUF4430)
VALAAAAAGCGFGPGAADEGEATLRVTRDYGAELVAEATVSEPAESETVIRLLDRETEIETRYGGGFVQSINGISGGVEGGRSVDWFFYVNGIESPVGSADVPVRGGDAIWWDHHDWTDAMRVPAVVGSWPEPFAQASAGADLAPVRVECSAARDTCDEAVERLSAEGVDAALEGRDGQAAGSGSEALRMLVGEWRLVRSDPAARPLAGGPSASGVFARFERGRKDAGWALEALDVRGRAALRLGPQSGLVAAVRESDDPPVWIVAGTDAAGTEAAVGLLSEDALRDRFAVASGGEGAIALPAGEGQG